MNQKGFINIILVSIIVVLVGVVGYFVLTKQSGAPATQQNSQTSQQSAAPSSDTTQTSSQQTSNQTTTDKTSSWKIYRNSKYGFEMRYPNDWLIEENQDSVYFKRTDMSQEEMERKEIGYPLIILIENTSAESILDWFENEFSNRAQNLRPEKHLMTIGGVNGIKYSDPLSIGGCNETFATIKNGKLFRFLRHDSTCNYSDELFMNIISTFKFIK